MPRACVRIKKIKALGTMTARFNHDYREVTVDNADPERISMNDFLVPIQDDDGNRISYTEGFKKRMKEVEQYQTRKIRSDAVLGYDVLIEFGDRDEIGEINIEDWEKQTVKWLKDTFNIAGDGRDNVLSVVCHKDESSPHIHAFVVPIDEENHLNARKFTGGYSTMSNVQTSYYEYVKDLGIERGIPRSSAHHKDVRKFYGELEKEIEIPMPEENETALEFRTRYFEELQIKSASAKRERDKKARDQQSRMDKERNAKRKELDGVTKEITQLRKENEQLETQMESTKTELRDLEKTIERLNSEIFDLELMKDKAEGFTKQIEAFEHLQSIEPERAEKIMSEITEVELEYEKYLVSQEQDMELNSGI